ncbi:2986_t:CDS:2 [Entrophospora sp. SA101]|nr:2986_t:CDS:2 [Entrophospora sp. SA101]CAJ0833997.1 717_t:CDS:2 [Entrophospora sp. SA101]
MSDSVNNFFEPVPSNQQEYKKLSDSVTSFQQDQQMSLHTSTTTGFNQNSNNITTSTSIAPIPKPPPYHEFVEYNWEPEFSMLFPPEEFSQQQLLDPADEKFIFVEDNNRNGEGIGNGNNDQNGLMISTGSDNSISNEIKQEIKSSTPKSSRKPYKELLTEEEKRANHIASEQKRRNTIRAGFKELTDIIPTLKNVNNSKSTILFKAVDYIKHLERRNRNLKERAGLLEMRVEMEMRQGGAYGHPPPTMGFGHQRVGPMSLGNTAAYNIMPQNGINMNTIPIQMSSHPPSQSHHSRQQQPSLQSPVAP